MGSRKNKNKDVYPVQILDIKSRGMDVIAIIKKSSRIKYEYESQQLNIKEIHSRNKKRCGRSKYLLSVIVMVGKNEPIPAKIAILLAEILDFQGASPIWGMESLSYELILLWKRYYE